MLPFRLEIDRDVREWNQTPDATAYHALVEQRAHEILQQKQDEERAIAESFSPEPFLRQVTGTVTSVSLYGMPFPEIENELGLGGFYPFLTLPKTSVTGVTLLELMSCDVATFLYPGHLPVEKGTMINGTVFVGESYDLTWIAETHRRPAGNMDGDQSHHVNETTPLGYRERALQNREIPLQLSFGHTTATPLPFGFDIHSPHNYRTERKEHGREWYIPSFDTDKLLDCARDLAR